VRDLSRELLEAAPGFEPGIRDLQSNVGNAQLLKKADLPAVFPRAYRARLCPPTAAGTPRGHILHKNEPLGKRQGNLHVQL